MSKDWFLEEVYKSTSHAKYILKKIESMEKIQKESLAKAKLAEVRHKVKHESKEEKAFFYNTTDRHGHFCIEYVSIFGRKTLRDRKIKDSSSANTNISSFRKLLLFVGL